MIKTDTFKVKIPVEKEVSTLFAEMGVRYWEDAWVNGKNDDEDDPKIPFYEKGVWRIKIDLKSGTIVGWPDGVTATTHYKVCDDGVYSLLDASGNVVVKKIGYVPHILAPEDDGYGDYVILNIGQDGKISGWEFDASYFEGE